MIEGMEKNNDDLNEEIKRLRGIIARYSIAFHGIAARGTAISPREVDDLAFG
jgi:hypothetical protein